MELEHKKKGMPWPLPAKGGVSEAPPRELLTIGGGVSLALAVSIYSNFLTKTRIRVPFKGAFLGRDMASKSLAEGLGL